MTEWEHQLHRGPRRGAGRPVTPEADPTLDVNGWDAAHKAIILASLAYGFWVPTDKIFVEGIEQITASDIRFAKKLGYAIKLLGIIKADEKSEIEVRVHPHAHHPGERTLARASVNGVFNALAVHGDIVGDTLFYGRGAGQDPTSSSVIADIAEAAIALQSPRSNYGFMPHGLYGTCNLDQRASFPNTTCASPSRIAPVSSRKWPVSSAA